MFGGNCYFCDGCRMPLRGSSYEGGVE